MSDESPRVVLLSFSGERLQAMKDKTARLAWGITISEAHAQNICIRCKKPPVTMTELGRREYKITALCEPCSDQIAATFAEQDRP
jgi:hypothetical protein